jgi:hypothetical protein
LVALVRYDKGLWLVKFVGTVEHYEKAHFPIADPDPIEFLLHVMDSQGLSRKDLEPIIGPRGRVADILNRTRPLTLEMIRRLVSQLNLPAEVLIKPYALAAAPAPPGNWPCWAMRKTRCRSARAGRTPARC